MITHTRLAARVNDASAVTGVAVGGAASRSTHVRAMHLVEPGGLGGQLQLLAQRRAIRGNGLGRIADVRGDIE